MPELSVENRRQLKKNPVMISFAALLYQTNRQRVQHIDSILYPGDKQKTKVIIARKKQGETSYESIVPAKETLLQGLVPNNNPDWTGVHVESGGQGITMICTRDGGMRIAGKSDGIDTLLRMDPIDRSRMVPDTHGELALTTEDLRSLSPITQDGIKHIVDQAISNLGQ